ncbi:MAG: hypothetical protein AB7G06_07450 [Bdellovibrionales bacterium]
MKKILGIMLLVALSAMTMTVAVPEPAHAGFSKKLKKALKNLADPSKNLNPFDHQKNKAKFGEAVIKDYAKLKNERTKMQMERWKKKAELGQDIAEHKFKTYDDHSRAYADLKNKRTEMQMERWKKKAELGEDIAKHKFNTYDDHSRAYADMKNQRTEMQMERWKKKAELGEDIAKHKFNTYDDHSRAYVDMKNQRNQMLQTQPVLGVAQTQPARIQPKDNESPQPMYAGTASGGQANLPDNIVVTNGTGNNGTVFIDGTNVTVAGASNGGTTAEQQNIRNIISELHHMYGGGGTVHNGTP